MHIAKCNQFRNNIRQQQITHIITQLRQQLTNDHPQHTTPTLPPTSINTLFPDIVDPDTLQFLQTETFNTQQQQKIPDYVQFFNDLMENRQNVSKQQCANPQQNAGMLYNYRLLAMCGKGTVDALKLGDIFEYLRFRIRKGLSLFECQQGNLISESQYQNLQYNYHLLHLTLIFFISEYLNQGGTFEQSENENWLIGQYQKWRTQLDEQLSKTIQLIELCYEDETKTSALGRQLHCIKYYLVELQEMTQALLYYKQQNYLKVVEELFNFKTVKMLVRLLKSYHFPDELQLQVCQIFAIMANLKNQEFFFKNLYETDYFQYVKLQLVIRQQYKNHTRKTKLDDKQKRVLNILRRIIYTLSCMALRLSDFLWRQGICHEIKSVIPEICNPRIKEDFTCFVLDCIVTATQPQKIYGWSDLMPWVISIIEQRIQEDNKEAREDVLIGNCLQVMRYFLQLGQQQMERQKLTCNPYLLQFKYLYGYQIFERSEQCREFLDQLGEEREGFL